VTIADRIEDHRALYRADLEIQQITSAPRVGSHRATRPPTTFDYGKAAWIQEPADANGMNLSGRMVKYLGHPEGYGSSFPWSKGWWLLRGHCRRSHRYHLTPPHWRGALCWQLVNLTIVQGMSVYNAARVTQYDNPEPLLNDAFDFIEAEIDKQRAKQEQRAREDAGRFDLYHEPPRHHVVGGVHEQECPNPVCRARRQAA
jgi:hypothetical protein